MVYCRIRAPTQIEINKNNETYNYNNTKIKNQTLNKLKIRKNNDFLYSIFTSLQKHPRKVAACEKPLKMRIIDEYLSNDLALEKFQQSILGSSELYSFDAVFQAKHQ